MKKENKGITLIALVITIIVLLILAAVSIATLTGENGILTKASTAKEETQKASAKEQAQIDILAWQTEKLKNGEHATLNNSIIKGILDGKDYVANAGDTSFTTTDGGYEISYLELYESNVKEYTEDEVPIPKGFYHVAGTTKDDGLVISDVEGDDLENSKGGNQFVWVPVEPSEFTRLNWRLWDGTNEPPALSSSCIEEASNDPTGKYDEMKASVETNHGFYIARFEAGKETIDGVDTVVSKKNQTVWNNITWGTSMTEIGTEGAVYRSLNFVKDTYTDKGKTVGVKSTLVYGIQWDAVMRWLSKDEELKGYITDSTGKGNYSDSDDTNNPAKTGAVDEYQMKNIYDMAGNVYEWSMETYDSGFDEEHDRRVLRGGVFVNSGSFGPVSSSNINIYPYNSGSGTGFRVTLYV